MYTKEKKKTLRVYLYIFKKKKALVTLIQKINKWHIEFLILKIKWCLRNFLTEETS